MNTRTDIRDGEQLTITVLVTEIDEWQNHDHIARKVLCKDIEGNELSLTIFHNNDAVEYDWDVGQWYKFKNATGNVYRGEKQLNPSYDFGIVPLDEPPEEATFVDDTPGLSNTSGDSDDEAEFQKASTVSQLGKTTADGGAALAQQPLSQGNYLLHFSMGELSELAVHVYKLNIPGGLDPSDEDLERGVLGFTAKAAALYRYRSDGPVTTNGPLKVYAVNKLRDELAVDGYTVQPEHVGTETLEARSFDDQESLRELVKQDVKAALGGKYEVTAINSIVEHTPYIKAKSGDFTASREYACRLWVDPDGTVICGVGVSLRFESTFSAAEYVQKGYDISGVTVTHDTELYEKDATGTVTHLIDQDYTDYDDQLGCSVAEWHRKKGRVEKDVVESLTAGEVVMAEIDYNGWEASQALNLCRVVPTLDQLKRVDPTFHERAQQESRMLPDERFTIATSFVKSIGETPALGLEPEGRPANVCYDELAANTGPNLRFANGQTASYGKQGLDRYGIHQAPDSLDLLALYPENYTEEAREFLNDLLGKLTDYGAEPTSLEQEAYSLGKEFGYTQVGQTATEADCVVAVVPDKDWVAEKESIDDPYPEFKKQFGQQKIPSQMVQVSNLGKRAYLGNIAAGIVAKSGGIPWRVHEVPGGADVFIGLDVTYDPGTGQHLGASANIVLADGTILASESVSLQQGETFEVDDVIRILKNLIRVYVKEEGSPPNHVVIHRDGQYYLDRDDLVERLEEASDFIPKFDLVEIRKSGNTRIGEYTGDSFEVAEKGVGFVSENGEHAYLATTGKPELKPGNSLGTPRPIRVVKRHGSTDLETLTKQVYWLSEAHVASISRSTRLPITTYYADRCADHARKGYLLNDELIRGVPYV